MTECVCGDQAADSNALRHGRHCAKHRPGLENIDEGIVIDSDEVVGDPAMVESDLVCEAPDGGLFVDRSSLPKELDADTDISCAVLRSSHYW